MSGDRVTFGEWLSQRMAERRLTTLSLATALGIEGHVVVRWRAGQWRPGRAMCLRLADVLGVPPDDVIRLAAEPGAKPGP